MVGSAIVGIWTIVRLVFWRRAGTRPVVTSQMPLLRRLLLTFVSASLVPVYLFYFTGLLDSFTVALPAWAKWAGNVLLATSVALFTWSHAALGKNWSVNVERTEGQSLVTKGPYRLVRHPMYSSLFLMAFGLVLATANPVAALPYLASITAMYFDRVGDEERLMLDTFGEQYEHYMRRTGRLVPPFGRHADA